MIKLYEESELKRLTTSEIDRMKDDTVFIQISETKFERKKDPEYDRYYDAYLCEVMDRDKYERRTKTGQLRKLKKKIHKLKEEKDNLSRRLDTTTAIARTETRERLEAEGTIEEMKAGFRELERVFGDLPPEIISLYRIPDREG
jgi:predicted  nucleic acid-binding Zn-ribbon protein